MYMPNLQGPDIWPSIISDYKCFNALIMYLKVCEGSFPVVDVDYSHIITSEQRASTKILPLASVSSVSLRVKKNLHNLDLCY